MKNVALIVFAAAFGAFAFAVGSYLLFPPASKYADRVFYADGSSREWGTLCKIGDGQWASVDHVTANGKPVVGPTEPVTASNAASDWSFLGVDPKEYEAAPMPVNGSSVTIAGFPARDRDGEVLPGRVYGPDTTAPFVWVELTNLEGNAPPEGVVGGVSGSCVLDEEGNVVAVVSANGFSFIENTTSTWALVVPLDAAVAEANGAEFGSVALAGPIGPLPKLDTSKNAIR